MRHNAACGCGRDDRNESSVDGFQVLAALAAGGVWAIARSPLEVTLCPVRPPTLPWLGFVPDEVSAAPPVAVARLGARLKVDPGVLACYGAREQTRTDHLLAVTDYLGWKSAPAAE